MIYAETRVPLTEEEKDIVGRVCVNRGAKDFLGIYPDQECMRLAGVSRNTFYKYKREIKVQFDFDFDTYVESFDEYADFSLEDLE